MKHTISLSLFLALLWWVLSGYPKPLLLGLGAFTVIFAVWLAHRLDVIDHESHPIHFSWPLLRFWSRLLVEITRSSAQVLGQILRGQSAIQPKFLSVRVQQRSALGRVILGNAITLTPGTVTVLTNGGKFVVHALSETSAKGVEDGELDALIPQDVEGESA
jgi:multicomponent Na+:H+ antiporter subunit E